MNAAPSRLTSPNGKPLLLMAATLLFILLAMVTSWLVFLPQRIAMGLRDDIQQHSGFVMDLAGPVRLGFDKGLVVEMEDISMTQTGGQGIPLLTVDRMILPVSIAGIFAGSNEAQEIYLDNPVVVLGADKGGKLIGEINAKNNGAIAAQANRPFKIFIRNGGIKMRFGQSGLGLNASDLDGAITWEAEQGLAATLNGLLNGVSTQFSIGLDDGWRALAEGSPAEISLASGGNQLSFSGRLRSTDRLLLDGRVQGQGNSLRDFCNWLSCNIQGFSASGPLEFESALSLSGDVVAFSELKLVLGTMKGSGGARLSQTATRPQLDVKLDFDVLDLAAYQKDPSSGTAVPFKLTQGWSEKPLDFADLGAFDGNLALTSKSLRFAGLQTGSAKLDLRLKDKRLDGGLSAENLEGGRFETTFSLDGQGPVPRLALKITTEEVEARRFLGSVLGFAGLGGPMNLKAEVTAEGLHVAGMISTLAGQVAIKVAKGKLHGVDLGKSLAGSGKGWNSKGQDEASLTTLATDLSVDVKLRDGVAKIHTADIKTIGLGFAATGEVDILRQHLDILAKPVMVRGQSDFKLPLQIKIAGPWEAPDIDPVVDGDGLKPALRLINKLVDGIDDSDGLDKIGKKAKKSIKKLFGN